VVRETINGNIHEVPARIDTTSGPRGEFHTERLVCSTRRVKIL
jgi:hypothetical protein